MPTANEPCWNDQQQRLVQLLVDDELDDGRRHELLEQLDASKDGWRRCALAFLEDQAWRRACRVAESPEPATILPASRPASRPAAGPADKSAASAVRRATVAASLLIGLAVGWAAGGWSAWQAQPAQELAGAQAACPECLAARPAAPVAGWETPAWPPAVYEVTIRLPSDDGTMQLVRLPAWEAPGLDAQWLLNQPGLVSPPLQEALEHLGHRVVQSRALVPFQLDDGRQLIVPVDRVEVEPLEDQVF